MRQRVHMCIGHLCADPARLGCLPSSPSDCAFSLLCPLVYSGTAFGMLIVSYIMPLKTNACPTATTASLVVLSTSPVRSYCVEC